MRKLVLTAGREPCFRHPLLFPGFVGTPGLHHQLTEELVMYVTHDLPPDIGIHRRIIGHEHMGMYLANTVLDSLQKACHGSFVDPTADTVRNWESLMQICDCHQRCQLEAMPAYPMS